MLRDRRSHPASLASLQRAWKRALARAGIRVRRLYQTRHTFVSNALAAGEPIAWVSEMTGVNIATLSKHCAKWLRGTNDGARLATRMAGGAPTPTAPPPATPSRRRLRLVRG